MGNGKELDCETRTIQVAIIACKERISREVLGPRPKFDQAFLRQRAGGPQTRRLATRRIVDREGLGPVHQLPDRSERDSWDCSPAFARISDVPFSGLFTASMRTF